LPLLKKVQTVPNSLDEVMTGASQAIKRLPGKYADEEEAANEEGGFAARAELIRMRGKQKILPMIPTPGQPVKIVARGDNMTEVWAMHVLLQMARMVSSNASGCATADAGNGKFLNVGMIVLPRTLVG
jgi:hypothetical protein